MDIFVLDVYILGRYSCRELGALDSHTVQTLVRQVIVHAVEVDFHLKLRFRLSAGRNACYQQFGVIISEAYIRFNVADIVRKLDFVELAVVVLIDVVLQHAIFVDTDTHSFVHHTHQVGKLHADLADRQTQSGIHLTVNGDVAQINIGLTSRQPYSHHNDEKQVV